MPPPTCTTPAAPCANRSDLPVNKRHYDMVYAHMRYSDKPFMGSVTHPQRAQDTVEMARILFGADALEAQPHVLSLINANSPLVWDTIMLGAAKAYAEANQAVIMTPFILAGAMSPATAAGAATQTLAEALAGMAYVQLVRPGAPVVFGSFASSMSMQSGADVRNAGACARAVRARRLRPQARGPFRSGGSLTASKVADAQAAYESANTLRPTILAGVNFVLHAAGWLGRARDGLREVRARSGPVRADARPRQGMDLSPNGQAVDAIVENGPGHHFLGTAHTLANFETAFYRSEMADNNSAVGTRGVAGQLRCVRTRSGRACWPSTRRRRSTRRRTRASRVDRAEEGELPGLERVTGMTAGPARVRRGRPIRHHVRRSRGRWNEVAVRLGRRRGGVLPRSSAPRCVRSWRRRSSS